MSASGRRGEAHCGVHFFDRSLEEKYPEKLLFGGIFGGLILSATGLVIAVLQVVMFATERDWTATAPGVGCLALSYALLAGVVARFRSTRQIGRLPLACLLAVVLSSVTIGFVGIGTKGGVLIAALLVLPVVAVALFGDVLAHLINWVVAVAVVAWSLSAQGTDRVAPAVVAFALLFGGIAIAIASVMRFLAQNLRLSEVFRNIDREVDEAMTYREALQTCLSRAAASAPELRAIVLVGEAEVELTSLLNWPTTWEPEVDLHALGRDPDVLAVARTGVACVRDDFAIMAVGYIDAGVVVVLMGRTATGVFGVVNELPYDLVAGALSQVALRVNSLRRLQSLSNTDPLTGLYNRRVLMERLSLEIDHVERDASPLCVAMIDLDEFKAYNDTYGHLAGDDLLKAVAGVFAQRLRKQDSAARYGGEEFCLVLPDTELVDGVVLVDQLREAVGALDLLGPVTFSAGVAGYEPDQSMLELIGRADNALYQAKEGGRDRVVAADSARLAPLRPRGPRTD